MHDLRRFISEQMDEHGWTGHGAQAKLARASGLSKQLIEKLVNDDRDQLDDMPHRRTIAGLAQAFNVPDQVVMMWAARAYGIPVDAPAVIPTTEGLSSAHLAGELFRRLQREEVRDGGNSAPTSTAPSSRSSATGATVRQLRAHPTEDDGLPDEAQAARTGEKETIDDEQDGN